MPQLVKANRRIAPVHSGLDGGMNRVFLAQVGGRIPPARVPPPGANGLPAQPPPVAVADNNGAVAGGQDFRRLLRLEDAGRRSRFGDAGARLGAGSDRHDATSRSRAPSVRPWRSAKPKLDLRKSDTKPEPQAAAQRQVAAKPAPAPQREANAAAATMGGAQPVVPAGNFDSRWGGLQ